MKICLVSLRHGLHWPRPCSCIQDAFFELVQRWLLEQGIEPSFYGISWGLEKPKRDERNLAAADWIFVFSSNEWTYHGTDVVNPLFAKGSNERLARMKPYFEGKRIVVFSIDMHDTEELLRHTTLRGVNLAELHFVSEAAFPTTVHSIRYGQIAKLGLKDIPKDRDLSYYGTTKRHVPGGAKSGDARYEIMRALLLDSTLHSFLAGNHFGKRKADSKFLAASWREIARARATVCFHWPGNGMRMTGRYHEALAMGMVPLVHVGYDQHRQLAKADWQHIANAAQARQQIVALRDPKVFRARYEEVLESYKANAPSDQSQYERLRKELEKVMARKPVATPTGTGGGAYVDPTIYKRKTVAEKLAGRKMTLPEFRASEYWTEAPPDTFSKAGRTAKAIGTTEWVKGKIEEGDISGGLASGQSGTSVFDPVLCELAYRWFCPPSGQVLDPFAGGSVRGIVASRLGRRYVGIDLSARQIAANKEQAKDICSDPQPKWIVGDSRDLAKLAKTEVDFIFSCPPYCDLEVYSEDPRDLSTMAHEDFKSAYRKIIASACARLKQDRFACFVVGDARGKSGGYYGLPFLTVEAFRAAGLELYNQAILVVQAGSLPIRAGKQFEISRKLGNTHQYVLIFVKGDARKATEAIGEVECGSFDSANGGLAEGLPAQPTQSFGGPVS
jgi:hypothetical protein